MRKYNKLFVILLLCVILTSCSSSSSSPFRREHESKDDVIKFYNLDWLVNIDTVKQALTKDYGDDSFTITTPTAYIPYGENAGSFLYGIHNKDNKDEPLNWEIGGYKINEIVLICANDPNVIAKKAKYENMYVYGAKYEYEPDYEIAKSLKKKLDNLYGNCEDGTHSIKDFNYLWKDANGNTVEIYLQDDDGYYLGDKWYSMRKYLSIEYRCGDIVEYLNNQDKNYTENKQKEEANKDKLQYNIQKSSSNMEGDFFV